MSETVVRGLLLDVGGVLLTKGWDRHARRRAADQFGLDYEAVQDRHDVAFHTYEEGRLSLEEYLELVVFYEKRDFTIDQFKKFIFEQSKPFPEMIDMVRGLKDQYNLRVAALSNEGRELTLYRIQTFHLQPLMDFLLFSCFVHTRKPDPGIYQLALDLMQLPMEQVIYIDDTPLLAEVGADIGIPTIHHAGYISTQLALKESGLTLH